MLDDRDARGEQRRWIGRSPPDGAVDVHRVDADHGRAAVDEPLRRSRGPEVRVRRIAVRLGGPVAVPPGVEQHRSSLDVEIAVVDPVDTTPGTSTTGQVEAAEVVAVGVAVERRVEVRARVRHHLDATDLELDPRPRTAPRGLAALRWSEMDGTGQPGVRDRPVAERVAQVDDQSSKPQGGDEGLLGDLDAPMFFIRFLPSFCFSRSLRLRVMSPP